jgi:outer membrane protein TolC
MPNHRPRTGVLALASLALLAAPSAAQQTTPPAELTLQQAVAATRERNPDLLTQRNDQRSARAASRSARADLLPSALAQADLGYTGAGVQRLGPQTFGERPFYYSSGYYLGLSYDLNGAKLMQPRIARAQETAVAARVEGYEANLVNQVAQQYITALQASEQVTQAQREVERTQEHERLAKARLDVGAGTPLDLRRAEVQRGQAQVAVLQQQNRYATEVLRLGQAMGEPLSVDTKLTSNFALFEPKWTAEELIERAQANNPNLAAARASANAARTGVRAARTQYLPSLRFNVGYQGSAYSAGDLDPLYNNALGSTQQQFAGCVQGNRFAALLGDTPRDCSGLDVRNEAVADSVRGSVRASNPSFPFGYTRQPLAAGVTFSLPLFNGLQRERQIEEARVAEQDAQLSVQSQQLRLRTEVETSLLALRTAYLVAQLQDQVVEKATEELRLARERFRFGAASSVEVTDAQTSLAEAERARIDAVYNFHKSLAALEALLGQPLRVNQ